MAPCEAINQMENDVIDLGWPGCAGAPGGLGGGDLMLRHFCHSLRESNNRPCQHGTDITAHFREKL